MSSPKLLSLFSERGNPAKKEPPSKKKGPLIYILKDSSHLPSYKLVGIGTLTAISRRLPRLRRASPSTSLDKKIESFNLILNLNISYLFS